MIYVHKFQAIIISRPILFQLYRILLKTCGIRGIHQTSWHWSFWHWTHVKLTLFKVKVGIPIRLQVHGMLHLLSNASNEQIFVSNSKKEISLGNASTKNNDEFSYTGSMKVTIKNKPILQSEEDNMNLLNWAFYTFLFHIQRIKRLGELKLKTHQKFMKMELQRYFKRWQSRVDDKKKAMMKRKNECDFSDERKIQLFVNAIVNKQENSVETLRVNPPECSSSDDKKNRLTTRSFSAADSSLQKRLSFQKKIITEQRWKLVQQNQIIEAMKLKKITEESQYAKKETLATAKKVLNKCNQRTRNNLIQLMKTEASHENSIDPPKLISSPPAFLSRMEARAERRRERMREAQEKQRIKLEIQKQQEEASLREAEEKLKNLRLDAQRKAKQIRQEQEKKKIMEAEKVRMVNELVTRFYKRYLLKNYVLIPFVRTIEREKHCQQIADNHYNMILLKKKFTIWKDVTREEIDLKIYRCTSICNANIIWRCFCQWMNITRETILNYQIAWNFYSARVRRKYLRVWYSEVLEMKLKSLETQQFVINYCDKRIKLKYLQIWQTYTKISDDVNESDRQKEKWRALVQNFVPNFCPKYRGVLRDD